MQITSPEQIKDGMLLFHVYKFEGERNGFIRPLRVIMYPFQNRFGIGLFLNVRKLDAGFNDTISLKDANVIPNNYNLHRLFTDEQEALNYIGK